jgi:chemotaxis protein MotB
MKGRKGQHDEEHIDENWLLPYSDMLTLLLALFIVMFAMSKVDSEKFKNISKQFNIIFDGGSGILQGDNGSIINIPDSISASEMNSLVEEDKMAGIKNTLESELKKSGYEDKISVTLNGEGLSINIQDSVIFNSGEADILEQFNPTLLQISAMLKSLDNEIRVIGHTDNVPIKNSKFHSNWDLSYMRALNVMNFMVDFGHIPPDKFSIQAYGQYNPKYDNSTEAGRAKNRRVDILVVRKYTAPSKNTK